MHCPFCRHPDSRVVDSRTADDGAAIRRRRQCPHCSRRFTTVENASLTVIKRSGVTEPFSRDKVIAGVRKACQGRPVTEDALAQLGQRVEEAVRATGSAELSTHDVGLAILGPLQDLDLVAYLRFASVYKAFESLEDFEAAISELREVQSLVPGAQENEAAGECEASVGSARAGKGRAAGGEARVLPEVPPPAGGGDPAAGPRAGQARGGEGASAAAAAD
ncbi:transcriptional regulator NrdR [Streptomyces sp. NPDC007063]|uniref:transcriptional regulator NrdR n=1 Tax=Streptomyces sp. NPDC007063 TaxID=3364772 RepID=UPI0036BE5288